MGRSAAVSSAGPATSSTAYAIPAVKLLVPEREPWHFRSVHGTASEPQATPGPLGVRCMSRKSAIPLQQPPRLTSWVFRSGRVATLETNVGDRSSASVVTAIRYDHGRPASPWLSTVVATKPTATRPGAPT